MNEPREKVVYDCNILLQFIFNANGPAAACVQAALDGRVELIVSEYLLAELREMPDRPTPRKLGLLPEHVDAAIQSLLATCTFVSHVPGIFVHPIDPDDSHYVNLALATGSKWIVSRDRHLLGLMDPAKPWSADFRARFPEINVLTVENFLQILRQNQDKPP